MKILQEVWGRGDYVVLCSRQQLLLVERTAADGDHVLCCAYKSWQMWG